jgi:hypothetical protein
MKTMTPTQATERLTAMIEPKPERVPKRGFYGRLSELSAWKLTWGDNGDKYQWEHEKDPLLDMNAAIRCVEAAGYRAAIGFVEHTQNTGEACVAMRSNVHYRTYYEYNDGNHALAICLALLHALEGEPVEIVDEGEVTP